MRNLFDQYEQRENRLSHALACCLHEDDRLRSRFLQWAIRVRCSGRDIGVSSQRVPGDDYERPETDGSLPDIWLWHGDEWALVIECKVGSGVNAGQLLRHRRTAGRAGFKQVYSLLLTATAKRARLPANTVHRHWCELYAWLREQPDQSLWCRRMAEYLEIAEIKFAQEGDLADSTLTRFEGFRFDDEQPYTRRRASRLIKLVMPELSARKDLIAIGVNPSDVRRGAISGGAWDLFPLRNLNGKKHEPFTASAHLTLGINRDNVTAALTIPHAVRSVIRKRLLGESFEDFQKVINAVARKFDRQFGTLKGAKPLFYVVQRHYRSQRSGAIEDARLWLDLRTAVRGRDKSVKQQPQWLQTVYDVLRHKRSNVQAGIEMQFSYDVKGIQDRDASMALIAKSWIACKPLIQRLAGKPNG